MNSQQISLLFTDADDYAILGHLNDVYRTALDTDAAEAETIARALLEYYLQEGRFRRLILEEANAGLAFRPDTRLWERFVALGVESTAILTGIRDAGAATTEIANFNRLKAVLDRRAGRLQDAETALLSLHGVLRQEEASDHKVAFVEYELGYVNFLQADADMAIEWFSKSYAHALAGGDEVGAWIGKCLEYRVRWLFGRAAPAAALSVFGAAKGQFVRLSVNSPKRLVARRWVVNALLHQIEVCFTLSDAVTARSIIEGCKVPPIVEYRSGDEWHLEFYEGLVALLEGAPDSVAWFEQVVARKVKLSDVLGTHKREAEAMDYFFLGLAYKSAGDVAQARVKWLAGSAMPNSMGNQIWRARCDSELFLLSMKL